MNSLTYLAEMVSQQGGHQLAHNAVLCGMLRSAATGQPLAEAVYEHLERAYATHLGDSTNQSMIAAFEESRELFLLALGIKDQDGPSPPRDGG